VIEKDNREPQSIAAEILRHYFEGEAMPGIENELKLAEQFLPGITLAELAALSSDLGGAENRVVLVSGPESMKKIGKKDVLALTGAIAKETIAPYDDGSDHGDLMSSPPAPGKVVAEQKIESIGVTEWKLDNGVRVILKPTDFKKDQVLVSAFSPG